MFIQTEATPNPATLKFLPGEEVAGAHVRDFTSPGEAGASPLAAAIFQIEGVRGVYLGSDFITVTKTADWEWSHLKAPILARIMEHFTSGRPVFAQAPNAGADDDEADIVYDADTQEIVDEIKAVIDARVRPAVAADGGDIVFHRFDKDSGLVELHMRGACAGCPSSTLTLKNGIENLLRTYVPEVTRVEQVL